MLDVPTRGPNSSIFMSDFITFTSRTAWNWIELSSFDFSLLPPLENFSYPKSNDLNQIDSNSIFLNLSNIQASQIQILPKSTSNPNIHTFGYFEHKSKFDWKGLDVRTHKIRTHPQTKLLVKFFFYINIKSEHWAVYLQVNFTENY